MLLLNWKIENNVIVNNTGSKRRIIFMNGQSDTVYEIPKAHVGFKTESRSDFCFPKMFLPGQVNNLTINLMNLMIACIESMDCLNVTYVTLGDKICF